MTGIQIRQSNLNYRIIFKPIIVYAVKVRRWQPGALVSLAV